MRLSQYDYSKNGYYFVTICNKDRTCCFGDVVNGDMVLNNAGTMVDDMWNRLSKKFDHISIDHYIIMPKHIHGIIIIGSGNTTGEHMGSPLHHDGTNANVGADPRACPNEKTMGMSQIIQWFKTMTTNKYMHGVRAYDWKPFDKKLWQRSFYDHIIRNECELNKICEYIINNPGEWENDELYEA